MTNYKKDNELIEMYEKMRETALSNGTPKTRGVGIMVQKGIAIWMEIIKDFDLPSKQRVELKPSSKTNISENNIQIDITNLLVDIALRNLRWQV